MKKYLLPFFLLFTISVHSQTVPYANAVYDALDENGYQVSYELTIRDTTFALYNPPWFIGDKYQSCTMIGTVKYSPLKDTLYLTMYMTRDIPTYQPNFGRFVRVGNNLVGEHYPPNTRKMTYKYLRDTTSLKPITSISNIVQMNSLLKQNYPNPFNNSTIIEFSLDIEEDVTVAIFDSIGRQILIVVKDHLNRGIYQYTWNSSYAASGIYFCVLRTKEKEMAVRMNLLR